MLYFKLNGIDAMKNIGRLHTGASQEKRKEAALILLFHVPLYR
jgi:hypothetical protein